MLGDGGITDFQVKATLNRITDVEYMRFVQKTIKKLFSLSSIVLHSQSDKGDNIVVSSKNLVEFLEKQGLKRGDKIRNEANIPDWVWKKRKFIASCLRGLVDTDGSFYPYVHRVNGNTYKNFAMCFSNYCKPLLNSTKEGLERLGFRPRAANRRIYLHGRADIERYFRVIGTNNPKHQKKWEGYRSLATTARSRKPRDP